jgi:peptide deformylase
MLFDEKTRLRILHERRKTSTLRQTRAVISAFDVSRYNPRKSQLESEILMILKVARLGHPVIRTKAQPVPVDKIKTHDFQKLLDDMVETMHEYSGVGLAGPQVHLPLQVAVLEVEHHPRYADMPSVPLTYIINPDVTVLETEKLNEFEGCLSIPDMRAMVPRFKKVHVKALGRNGEMLDFIAEDFHARVIQHETDHLKGEVYLDRMPDMRTLAHLAEWQRYVLPELSRKESKD